MHRPINIKFRDSSFIGRNNDVLNKKNFNRKLILNNFRVPSSQFWKRKQKKKNECRVYSVVSLLGFLKSKLTKRILMNFGKGCLHLNFKYALFRSLELRYNTYFTRRTKSFLRISTGNEKSIKRRIHCKKYRQNSVM